jgi:hypothetical protein
MGLHAGWFHVEQEGLSERISQMRCPLRKFFDVNDWVIFFVVS